MFTSAASHVACMWGSLFCHRDVSSLWLVWWVSRAVDEQPMQSRSAILVISLIRSLSLMLKQTDVDKEQLDPTEAIVQSDGSVHELAFCTQGILRGSFLCTLACYKS